MEFHYLPARGRREPACLLALPPARSRGVDPLPLVISVHGVTRQPLEHAQVFAPLARARGWALLLPVFDEEVHGSYQQLVHPRRGTRSDLALLALVERLARRHGLQAGGFGLFGYSGGAQFAHRFAMLHADRLGALALGAAGWYTWPDRQRPYPLGWQDAEQRLGAPDLECFLRLPMRLWVGERDDEPDRHFRDEPELSAWQGDGRRVRAERWAEAVQAAASQRGLTQAPAVHVVPRAGHSFTACQRRGHMCEEVMAFFEPVLARKSPQAPRRKT
jgi:poly(3-hydroxybutyrate) depolymerase